jgi:hypothetical protein
MSIAPSTRLASFIALALFVATGCSRLKAATGESNDDTTSTSSVSPGNVRVEMIADPTLGMNAAELKVPEKWHFEGTLIQGGKCVPVPYAVFRETSPDGLSFAERLPVLGWEWGTGWAAKADHSECLPLHEAMSAQEFLKYIAGTLNVEYVADEPVPPEIEANAQQMLNDAKATFAPKYAAMHMAPPTNTRQLARAIVRYTNGTFMMKGRLAGVVNCSTTQHAGVRSILRGIADQPAWTSNECQASVQYISAPQDRYDATVAMFDSKELESRGMLPEWSQAWTVRNQQEANAAMARMNAETQAAMRASAQRFSHDQAVRQHMHEQFLATMQRGTNMSMARAAQVANTNHRIASDWVDYSLDRQTVRDPTTGQISKVSNAASYTWMDSSGKTSFQTRDPNANPNGALQGTWTRQETVHGDGTN